MKKYYKLLLTFVATVVIAFHSLPLYTKLHNYKVIKSPKVEKKDIKIPKTWKLFIDLNKVKKDSIIAIDVAKVDIVPSEIKVINESSKNISRGGTLEEVLTVAQQIESDKGWFDVIITFYTSSSLNCGNSKGITASGKHIKCGMIASPSSFSFGTQLYIPERGVVTVEDRGGAIKSTYENGKKYIKLDVFIPNISQRNLLKMGKVYSKAKIIKPN